ncbi:integrase catalytic domain-containing protein [Trichonephila clavipes]|nr:integrase catalytic domain-containing protein [Trichonephila clavipes]
MKKQFFSEDHFLKTHSRDDEGRYVVKMPLKNEPNCLGESRDIALKRLNALWTRLIRDPRYLNLYIDFIHEYEQLGRMKEVVAENDNSEIAYYMPHHGILRPEKSTTKLRVVFNATNPTSNGLSLNSIQYNGGLVKNYLFTIMIKYREHPYAFTADVKMMYRMILIHESQQPLLRILWKESPEDPVKTFEMKTVTYGKRDLLYGRRSLRRCVFNGSQGLEKSSFRHFEKEGMKLRKWGTSHPELASNIIGDYEFENPIETKTLGVSWISQEDCLIFKIAVKLKDSYTKRCILSTIATLFDPLGLLGPVVARAKIFMQSLWGLKIDWIDELSSERAKEWHRFLEDFNSVSSTCIGRCIVHPQATRVELHGFADASEKCYGAVIYCRSQSPDDATTVKLVTNKSRVAPVKSVTMPRLELFIANCRGEERRGPLDVQEKNRAEVTLTRIVQLQEFKRDIKSLKENSRVFPESVIKSLNPFLDQDGVLRAGGANAELKRFYKLVINPDPELAGFLVDENINWKFLPPRAANFGGLWEAGVKSFEFPFKREAGNSRFNYEEFLTIMTQIEGILNFRPLTPLSTDIDDLSVLTPTHFLIGPITSISEPNIIHVETNRLNIYQRLTKIVQSIWERWSNNYLSNLQQRSKWKFEKDNARVGDLVLIKEDN